MMIPRLSIPWRRSAPLSIVLLAGMLSGCYYPPYAYPQYSYNYYPAYPAYGYSYYYPSLYSPYFYGYPSAQSSNGGNGR